MVRFWGESIAQVAVSLLLGAVGVSGSLQIIPGGTWTADDGEHMQAHGAGVIHENGTYYLIGEDKTGGTPFQNINCYASEDLVSWRRVGALLSRTASGDLGPDRVVERPKVIFNEETGKYVLWMHIDSRDYGEAKVGVATGDEVCGKYTYQRSFRPFGFQSRDMGLFKDDDGKAYLLTEDRENGLRIESLTDDYTDVSDHVYRWSERIESPAMLKHEGRYYMFGSHLTGWDPNDNVYSTATSLSGPWSPWREFADDGSNTYFSQSTYILPYGTNNIMYMGDRWRSQNLMSSTYVWLPLTVSGTTVTLKNHISWIPNLLSPDGKAPGGSWTTAVSETSYEGENATPGGAAREVSCGSCSGGRAMGYLGGPDNGSLTFSDVRTERAGRTTVRVNYVNGDSGSRYAKVSVNGEVVVEKLAFLPSRGETWSSALLVDLREGGNEVVFEGVGGGWGPDIDRVFVPVE